MANKAVKLLAVGLVALLAVVLLVGFANAAHAQECGASKPIEAGAVAPCTGIIFPHPWAVQSINCIDVDLPMAKERDSLCRMMAAQSADTCAKKTASYVAQIKDLEKLTRESAAPPNPWYRSPVLWFLVGATTSAAIITAIK